MQKSQVHIQSGNVAFLPCILIEKRTSYFLGINVINGEDHHGSRPWFFHLFQHSFSRQMGPRGPFGPMNPKWEKNTIHLNHLNN